MIVPEAEEVANVLLGGCGGDARNVNGRLVRHYGKITRMVKCKIRVCLGRKQEENLIL